MRTTTWVGALLAALAGQAAWAEDRFPTVRDDDFEWGLGVGALIEDEGYAGIGFETEPQPILYFNTGRLRFFANQLDYRVLERGPFLLSVKAEARFDGFEPEDDPLFAGMEEREGGIYAGLRAEYRAPAVNLVGEWVREAVGDSDGSYGSIGAYRSFDTGFGRLVPKFAVEFYDKHYTDYYYGVRAGEALANRPAYEPGAVVNFDLGIDYLVDFGEHHHLISSAKYRHYGSEVKDSPLVDDSGSARFILGYLYTF